MDIWLAVLSSSVISGTVGAGIAGWVTLRSKRNDYENAYFKIVLDKRVAAYEEVELFLAAAKVAIVGEDNRTHHAMFTSEADRIPDFYILIHKAMSSGFWLSDGLFKALRKLNIIIIEARDDRDKLLELAKTRYSELAILRSEIEQLHMKDMLTLHLVPKFLKSKRHTNKFDVLP